MDELQAVVETRVQSFMDDMRYASLPITHHSINILEDIIDMMYPRMDDEYVLDLMAVNSMRLMLKEVSANRTLN